MKYPVLLSLIMMIFINCVSKRTPESVGMGIKYYKLGGSQKHQEEIIVEKWVPNETEKHFRYRYKFMTDEDHLLKMYKDSIVLNGTPLTFVSHKVFTENETKYKIKRFDWEPFTPGEVSAPFNQVYLNDTLGLLLVYSISWNNVTEYYPENIKKLPTLILKDTAFNN